MSSSDYFSKEARRARQQAREQREAEARYFHGRRYYAGVALKYLLEQEWFETWAAEELDDAGKAHVAKIAFEWADAMLAAEEENAK